MLKGWMQRDCSITLTDRAGEKQHLFCSPAAQPQQVNQCNWVFQANTWRCSVHNLIMVMEVVFSCAVDLISNGILGVVFFLVLLLYPASLPLCCLCSPHLLPFFFLSYSPSLLFCSLSLSQLHSIKPSKITDDCQAALPLVFFIFISLLFMIGLPSRQGSTCHS